MKSLRDILPSAWDLGAIGRVPVIGKRSEQRYYLRLLGYWFIRHLLAWEAAGGKTPAICEIEPDLGQMLAFARSAAHRRPLPYKTWDAAGIALRHDILHQAGYHHVYEGSLSRFRHVWENSYDAIILLNTLERAGEPAALLKDLMPCLRRGGVFAGGVHSGKGGISACSLKQTAQDLGLRLEFMSGTFLLPARGRLPEGSVWWIRGNLFLGALLPALSGNLYWLLRKKT